MPIRPLTHRNSAGEPYRRRVDVEAQIAAINNLPDETLLSRAAVRDETDPQFLRDETLFFLLRDWSHAGKKSGCRELWNALLLRCQTYSRATLRSLSPEDAEDVYQQVLRLLVALIDSRGDEGDYCEVSFRQFFVSRLHDGYRKADAQRVRERAYVRLDEDPTGSDAPHSPRQENFIDRTAWTAEASDRRLLGAQALRELEAQFERDLRPYRAFLLQTYEGWPVGPKTTVGTIANMYGVSEHTINNWTRKVEAFLVEWRERNLK